AEEYERFPADGTPPESEATLFGRLPSAATVPVPRPAPRPADPTTPPLGIPAITRRPPPPPELLIPRPLPRPAAPAPPVPPPSGPAPPARVGAGRGRGEGPERGRADIARPPGRPAEAPKERPAEAPKTLLLVDDEEDVRMFLARRFAAAGYEVVPAADPEMAVKTGGKLAKAGVTFLLLSTLR